MSFIESLDAVGLEISIYDSATGWPDLLDIERLVILQFPDSKSLQSGLSAGLKALSSTKAKRWAGLYIGGGGAALDSLVETTSFAMSVEEFSTYLTKHRIKPSSHITNWFNARGGFDAPTPNTRLPKTEKKEARQDRRLLLCIEAGLDMPSRHVGRLPDGIADVAKKEGVSRQSFTTDVKAALKRKEHINREGGTVHRS